MRGLADLLRRWQLAARPGVPVPGVGRAALGHAHAVFVIDVAGKQLLIGTGPQTTTLLDVLRNGAAVPDSYSSACAEFSSAGRAQRRGPRTPGDA
jgi:flagellar biogenesis protein FliO